MPSRSHEDLGVRTSSDTSLPDGSFAAPLLGDGRPRMLQRSNSAPQLLTESFEKCLECRPMPGPGDGELTRGLGSVELTLLGVGACLGAGIFVLTGVEARAAGPSVALSFGIAASSSVFNGLCYAELSSRLPISGSAYLYAYCMFGELPAMIVVVNQLLDYHIGAATMSRSVVAYVSEAIAAMGLPLHECFVQCEPFAAAPWLSVSLGAPLMLLGVTAVVAGGAKTNATVTSFMTILKMGIVVLVIIVGTRMVDVDRWQPFFPFGLGATLQAAATLNYAFIGYDVIANAAEETRNPQRDIPVAIVGCVSICAVLYLVVCMVLCGMQNFSEIDLSAPLASAFIQHDMVWVASTINLGAFFGITTGLLAGIYGQSRIYFALARDQLAPQICKQLALSSAWCGSISAILAAVINVKELASMLNIGVLLAYSATAASVLRINSKHRCEEMARNAFVGSENFWIALLVLLTLLFSHGDALSPLLPGLAAAGLLCVISWVCLRREYSTCPGGAFKCPGVPLTPMVALVTDIYLASKLSSNAWLRLGVTSLLVTLVLGVVTLRGLTKEMRQDVICETVRAAAKAAGTEPRVCAKC